MPSEAVKQGMDDHVSNELDGVKCHTHSIANIGRKKGGLEFLVCKQAPKHGVEELVDRGRPMKRKKVTIQQHQLLLGSTKFFTSSIKHLECFSSRSMAASTPKLTVHAQPEDSNELFQKLLEDLQIIKKELIECNHPTFFEYNEDHSSNEIATSNKEKEGPPQDFDIRKLIREECCKEVCEEQKQNMENMILELVEICRQKELYCMHDNVDDLIKSALNFKLLLINSQRLNKEKQEVKNVELVPILSENEVTSEDKKECDVPVCENSPICDDHSDILSDSNNDDDISSDDDDFEDIEYVEASLPDPKIIVLHEKLLSINHLFANIESLNDNPTPDRVLNSYVSFPISEESNNSISDNFLPEFKTFCDHTEETRSGITTTHADDSLSEYDSFCFDIEPDQERLINVVKNDISDDSSNDPLLEEADLFLASDNSIPQGFTPH
nr:hypothetical protein [Tanacetum cinerariifolium]